MRVELVVATPDADLLVVNAARASFGKEVQELSGKDAKLINFLARERHLLPFRHPHITLRCKAPMFVARQLGKHQTGMTWSEESRRYIDSEPEFFVPDMWRKKADNVKQGSSSEKIELPVTGKCAVCGETLVYPDDPKIRAAHVARARFCSGRCQTTNYRREHPYDNRFTRWKASAKAKGMDFTITDEDLTWPDKCPYLDVELDYTAEGDKHDATASLDRIDSSQGYVPGNVQIISNLANRMKNDADTDNLVKFAKNVLAIHSGTFVSSSDSYEGYLDSVKATYNRLIENGVAPEQARIILPVSHEITWVWTGSLLGWVHMIRERSHPTAQKETRDFAAMVRGVVEDIAPASVSALMEHWHG